MSFGLPCLGLGWCVEALLVGRCDLLGFWVFMVFAFIGVSLDCFGVYVGLGCTWWGLQGVRWSGGCLFGGGAFFVVDGFLVVGCILVGLEGCVLSGLFSGLAPVDFRVFRGLI